MKKKIVALLLAFVMLVGIIPAAVYAASDAKVTLTVTPDKEIAKAGDEVTFTVTMSTEEALASMAFTTVFPEGLAYVDESGSVNAEAKSTFGLDDLAWTEWSERSEVKGDNYINGYGSKPKAGEAVVCTFKATLAEDAEPGEYAVDLTGLDEFCDTDWNVFDESDIEVISNPVTIEVEPKVILTVTPEKETAVVGEEVAFTVTMSTEEKLASMAFTTVFPEGLAYVDESGSVNAEAKSTFGLDDLAWTEWTERSDVPGDNYINGYGSKPTAGEAVVCTFTVAVAEDAELGEYIVDLAGLDEFCDPDWNVFDIAEIKVVSNALTVIDHVCTADMLTAVEAVDPTCTEDGNAAYYVCDECGTKYVDEAMSEIIPDVIVPALGHTQGEVVVENEVAADCVNDGSYDEVVYCTVCGEELSRDTITEDALGHTEGQVVVENEVAADCVNDGSYDEVVYCTVCGEELSRDTITVDALGHVEAEAVKENISSTTCTEPGSYDQVIYCSVCGEELSRETVTGQAPGHAEGEVVIENEVAATCTEEGSYDEVIYCSVCDEELSRDTITVDALGHEYEAAVTDPTCTEAGYTTYTCSVCGDSYIADEVAALGHTDGDVVVENEVEPDCVNDGSYDNVVYCTVCDAEVSRETIVVPALGHIAGEVAIENEVEPTCTEEGSYDEVIYCEVCDEELSRDTITEDALGHTQGEVVVENEVAATCTEEGSYDEVIYCSVCDEELSRDTITVDALGHEYEAVVTDPTCTEAGYTTYTCSVCGDSYVADEVAALGHTPADEYVEDANKPGTWYLYCTVCGALLDEDVRTVDATGIKLDQDNVRTKYIRKAVAFTLTETVLPEDQLLNEYDVIWTSSNEKVATVDEDGNVTTHHRGDAVITATLVDAEGNVIASDTCTVEVYYTFCQWLIWFFLIGCAWYFV